MNEPPIWVISLQRASARREFARRAFADAGLAFEFVEGVDGWALGNLEDVGYSRWRALFECGRTLTPGDVGCSLSHLRAYERIVAEELPAVVLVEDDVEPTPALGDVLPHLDVLPSDWDVVTFHSLFDSSRPVPVGDRRVGAYRVCRYERVPFGTQCYLITLEAARRLVAVGYPVRLPADELVFRRRPAGLTVYGFEPRVVVEHDFGTELRRGEPEASSLAERTVALAGKAWRRGRHLLSGVAPSSQEPR